MENIKLIPLNKKDLKEHEKIPYKMIRDIPFTCGIIKENQAVVLGNDALNKEGLSFDRLFNISNKNIKKEDFVIYSIADGFPFYCISNRQLLYGANVLTRTDIIEAIAKDYDIDNVLLIPSSKHEIIMTDLNLYIENEISLDEVKNLVAEVNSDRTALDENDILSYNLYIIRDGQLEIATEKDFSINRDEENSFEL